VRQAKLVRSSRWSFLLQRYDRFGSALVQVLRADGKPRAEQLSTVLSWDRNLPASRDQVTAFIGRREFITLLGGAAVAWPLAARAQQLGKLPTVGFLGTTTSAAWGGWLNAFVQRLRELNWNEGRNFAIDVRWAEGSTVSASRPSGRAFDHKTRRAQSAG
jgi:hypothetical protein